jgi:nucleotide-binding universal stress UspA family protein
MPHPPVFLPLEPIPLEMDGEWYDADARIKQLLADERLAGIPCEGVTRRGALWFVIDDAIQTNSVELIILGSHGRHGLKKLVLGSDAEQIFRHARCPVLTIGPKVAPRGMIDGFHNIIFATDFSSGSLHSLQYALSLAEESQANLTLLHVIPLVPLQHQDSIAASTKAQLEELVPSEARDWCRPECVVRFEFPAEAILNLAKEHNADLIVMGVHKRAAFASAHLPWAVAYEVVCDAPCPVLTVRD